MTSTYLRLSAPLQSWATSRVTGNIVRTQPEPTADALRGLVAASLGAQRGHWPHWLSELQFTIRVDRPGTLVDEFQTINPREEDLEFQRRLFALTTGKSWTKSSHFTPDGQNLTAIVRRTYLGDAEFLVEVRAPMHADEVAQALRRPKFTPYLGRKAFAPTFPYYLGVGSPGLLATLPTLARKVDGEREHSREMSGPETAELRMIAGTEQAVVEVPALPYADWLDAVRGRLAVSA